MSSSFLPSVDPDVFQLRPDYCALSIVARGIDNTRSREAQGASELTPAGLDRAPVEWAEPHFEAWRAAYRAFGAKPQRTPCSAEALRKRLDSGTRPPAVNPAVDLYNALSLRYAIPIGGENVAAYQGSPRLIRADGAEMFDTVKDGVPHSESIPRGEIIWRDDRGATCRRWNWRQGVRTRIDEATRDMWFVLERLEPLPISTLLQAGDELMSVLRQWSPESSVAATLIDASGSTARI
jgi:DNA/RNA-binding domain of Phe-tRNA-synthetase-like protein